MPARIKDVLPFREFTRRRQVLTLFRSMLRAANQLEDSALRTSITKEIGAGFRQNRDLRDPVAVKVTIQEAHRQMKQLQSMGQNSSAYDADSWINQSEPDDERGRVGKGWPWG
jgi:hypothetical protein